MGIKDMVILGCDVWMNAVARKCHPHSKTIEVVDHYLSADDDMNLEYNRKFDGYSNDHFTSANAADILGYKFTKTYFGEKHSLVIIGAKKK